MTTPLFEDPSVYEDEPRRAATRAFALGGVLQILRASKGWSVEQAAVHAGLGHMTWRRMEDGFTVRNKTYAAVDELFDLPFGTVKRALADDMLMLDLIERVGVEVPADRSPAVVADFIQLFAHQTLTNTSRQAVKARASAVLPPLKPPTRPRAVEPAREVVARAPLPASDVEVAANLLDRLSRRHLTPRLEAAMRALLDAMPDLIEILGRRPPASAVGLAHPSRSSDIR